ncbi:MAG: zinc-dependent peptidase [Bacteroidetes bacterium]|nr:zinc-dependent peptidase [Bacteroidota bacterium]MBU1719392.1 zinc-dependent peptidase [Bacteroidota bacterium]
MADKTDIQNAILRCDKILAGRNPYYQRLSKIGKIKFLRRLVRFMEEKRWTGQRGIQVTGEMKVLISGTAIQLTFGLKNFNLHHFHTINVWPDKYESKVAPGEIHLGSATKTGVINLSWNYYQMGYAIPNDRINLGLHEMAHALEINYLFGADFDVYFACFIDLWEQKRREESHKLAVGENTFLRAYGGNNPREFFAVCVEAFFETPAELRSAMPETFIFLCMILNQNPENVLSDYAFHNSLKGKIPISPDQLKKYNSLKKENRHLYDQYYLSQRGQISLLMVLATLALLFLPIFTGLPVFLVAALASYLAFRAVKQDESKGK